MGFSEKSPSGKKGKGCDRSVKSERGRSYYSFGMLTRTLGNLPQKGKGGPSPSTRGKKKKSQKKGGVLTYMEKIQYTLREGGPRKKGPKGERRKRKSLLTKSYGERHRKKTRPRRGGGVRPSISSKDRLSIQRKKVFRHGGKCEAQEEGGGKERLPSGRRRERPFIAEKKKAAVKGSKVGGRSVPPPKKRASNRALIYLGEKTPFAGKGHSN